MLLVSEGPPPKKKEGDGFCVRWTAIGRDTARPIHGRGDERNSSQFMEQGIARNIYRTLSEATSSSSESRHGTQAEKSETGEKWA